MQHLYSTRIEGATITQICELAISLNSRKNRFAVHHKKNPGFNRYGKTRRVFAVNCIKIEQ